MDFVLVMLFAAGFVSAALANGLFFWMQDKLVEEAGIPAKQWLFVTDIYYLLKNYHQMARSKGLSAFPVAFFVLAVLLTFASFLALVIRLQIVSG
jgi:hypothetical protein